ncbi:MAG TPA: PQQ-dependent sugar dehydrogenase [Longimicrobiaceae bacterium]|nr:PQQ-dependent sugar dehydrogenase [Longimicrobiaceae bacterium]
MAVQEVTDELKRPWGMAFLRDGCLLVTERPGDLRIATMDGKVPDPVKVTPTVFAEGQGGLHDVALDPQFGENRYVYLSYAAPGPEGSAASAVGRGRWNDDRIEDFQVIFRQEPWITGPNHFGNRIVFSPQGHLFLALGERFQFQPAQDLSNHPGTVVRIHRDGTVPRDNPFVGRSGARAAIWSYGHRNIESAASHPATGALWIAEMGPLGGDELNLPEPGRNYGWPVVSWGINYDGSDIPDPPTQPRFADAVKHWSPVISPSGMAFYTGSVFPAWRGSALIGGLTAQGIVRVETDGRTVTGEERIPLDARIRDVEQGPDGMVYVITDHEEGKLWRVSPLKRP